MSKTKIQEQIRNSSGSLVCDASFSGGIWTVTIKRKDIYTILELYKDGDIVVENYKANHPELTCSLVIPM